MIFNESLCDFEVILSKFIETIDWTYSNVIKAPK